MKLNKKQNVSIIFSTYKLLKMNWIISIDCTIDWNRII